MKVKPPIITAEELAEQTQSLTKQRDTLEVTLKQVQHRVHQIENSLAENDALKKRVTELMSESLSLFSTEWVRKSEYYPEIRVSTMQKAVELLAPPPKK